MEVEGGAAAAASSATLPPAAAGTRAMHRETLRDIVWQYHALSWLNVSPRFPERQSALPLHLAVLSRLQPLWHMSVREKRK